MQRMNIVIVGPRRPRQEHGHRPPAGRHPLAPRGQAGADPGPVRAQLEAVRVRLPARRAQGRTGPGHHHRRRAGVLQERPAALPDPRRARPHRVPQEHDHRRRARRGGAAGDRRRRRRPGELPPPRLHGVAARHPAARRRGEQDGPGRLGPRRSTTASSASTARSSIRSASGPPCFIPVSARGGDNIADRSAQLPWYQGPTVLDALDQFHTEPAPVELPFRMPVQDVYKFTKQGDDRRIVAGTIDSGAVNVGDTVVFYPSGKKSRVKSIEAFNRPAQGRAEAGRAVGFTLQEQIYITRGEMATLESQPRPAGHHPAPGQPVLARQGADGQAEGVPAQAGHRPGDRPDRGGPPGHGRLDARHRRAAERRPAARRGRVRARARPRHRVRPGRRTSRPPAGS